MSTIREIEDAIGKLDAREQLQLVRDLPSLLQVDLDDFGWLQAAEPSFEFWNNEEDTVYDDL